MSGAQSVAHFCRQDGMKIAGLEALLVHGFQHVRYRIACSAQGCGCEALKPSDKMPKCCWAFHDCATCAKQTFLLVCVRIHHGEIHLQKLQTNQNAGERAVSVACACAGTSDKRSKCLISLHDSALLSGAPIGAGRLDKPRVNATAMLQNQSAQGHAAH